MLYGCAHFMKDGMKTKVRTTIGLRLLFFPDAAAKMFPQRKSGGSGPPPLPPTPYLTFPLPPETDLGESWRGGGEIEGGGDGGGSVARYGKIGRGGKENESGRAVRRTCRTFPLPLLLRSTFVAGGGGGGEGKRSLTSTPLVCMSSARVVPQFCAYVVHSRTQRGAWWLFLAPCYLHTSWRSPPSPSLSRRGRQSTSSSLASWLPLLFKQRKSKQARGGGFQCRAFPASFSPLPLIPLPPIAGKSGRGGGARRRLGG